MKLKWLELFAYDGKEVCTNIHRTHLRYLAEMSHTSNLYFDVAVASLSDPDYEKRPGFMFSYLASLPPLPVLDQKFGNISPAVSSGNVTPMASKQGSNVTMHEAFSTAVNSFPFWPPVFIPVTLNWITTTPAQLQPADLERLMNMISVHGRCEFPLEWISQHNLMKDQLATNLVLDSNGIHPCMTDLILKSTTEIRAQSLSKMFRALGEHFILCNWLM